MGKKRFIILFLTISLIMTGLPITTISVKAATSLDFCGITLATEAKVEPGEFVNTEDTWVLGTEEYHGVSNYLMSTNCDKENQETETIYDDSTYAITFTMPFNGKLNFKASVSGEEDYDYLTVLVGGMEVYSTEDIYQQDWESNPWIGVSVMAKSGEKVSIGYRKDGSVSAYEDRAYISDLVLENLNLVFSDEIADVSWYTGAQETYTISTKEELCGFSTLVNEGVDFKGCTVNLANDIDMSGIAWIPAGQYNLFYYFNGPEPLLVEEEEVNIPGLASYFAGTFDGQGYEISNLYCNYTYPETTYIGFIGMNFGTIQNLEMVNPIIGDGGLAKSAGAIAGFNSGVIDGCGVTGGQIDIVWNNFFLAYAGGLVGTNGYAFTLPIEFINLEGGTITNSYSEADVQVQYTLSEYFYNNEELDQEIYLAAAGGLLGATYGGNIENCYSVGNVNAIAIVPQDEEFELSAINNNTYAVSGGLIGMVLSSIPMWEEVPTVDNIDSPSELPVDEMPIAQIKKCYAAGLVSATGPSVTNELKSGFLGFARNMTPNGEVPYYLFEVTDCYFNTETTGRANSFKIKSQLPEVTGVSISQMQAQSTFINWDFNQIWSIYTNINQGFPVLKNVGVGNVRTVTFLDDNGNVLKTEYVQYGEDATPPSVSARQGYTFIGWDKTYTDVKTDLTVKAVYNINSVSNNNVIVEGINNTSFNIHTVLLVRRITDSTTQTDRTNYERQINNLSPGRQLLDLFDVNLLINNQVVQPDGKIKVKIKLTAEQLSFSNLEIVYIDNNGKVSIIPSTIEDGYIVFVTDHLSNYGIIGKANVAVKTGDSANATPWVALLVISSVCTCIIFVLRIRKRRV